MNTFQKIDVKAAKNLKKILESRDIKISFRYARILVRGSSK